MRPWPLLALALAACATSPGFQVTPGEPVDPGGKADGATAGDAPRVELKVMVATGAIDATRDTLGLTNKAAQDRDVWFYDDQALNLYRAGLVLRARNIAGDPDDSTAKVRPADPATIDPLWFTLDGFKCETDRTPDHAVTSCQLTVPQGEHEIADVAHGDRPVDKLFSTEQETFLAEHGGVTWDQVVPLGPIPAQVWTVHTPDLPAKLVAERWTLPGTPQLLELSIRVDAADADAGMASLLGFLADQGIPVGTQGTKTRLALEELSGVDLGP